MTAPIQPRWLTREQAAEYLGCSVNTIDEIRKAGHIDPHALLDSRQLLRFSVEDLDAYVASTRRLSQL